MEKNKTLWIVVAVGVFLLIISGTAWILYGPERGSTPQLQNTLAVRGTSNQNTALSQNQDIQSSDSSAASETQSGRATDGTTVQGRTYGMDSSVVIDGAPPRGDINLTIVTGQNNTNWGTLDVSGLTRSTGTPVESAGSGLASGQTVNTDAPPRTSTPGQAATSVQTTAGTNQTAVKPAQTTRTAASSTATPSTDTTRTTTATGTRSTSTAPTRTAATTTVTEYWIQTGAFTSKLNAERSRDELSNRYLSAEIFTRDISGTTSYRVRVGPYSNKTEAEYWLTRIREIPAFSGSYVSEVKTRK